jgi:hypothetical protein
MDVLEGASPAIVREAVERAKLHAIRHGRLFITGTELLVTAKQLQRQRDLMNSKLTDETLEQKLGIAVKDVVKRSLSEYHD